MERGLERILGSDGTVGQTSDPRGGSLHFEAPAPNPANDDADD